MGWLRFLAFPIAGLGFLIFYVSGASVGLSLVAGPLTAFFLVGMALPILWPVEGLKKKKSPKGPQIRVHPHDDHKRHQGKT